MTDVERRLALIHGSRGRARLAVELFASQPLVAIKVGPREKNAMAVLDRDQAVVVRDALARFVELVDAIEAGE